MVKNNAPHIRDALSYTLVIVYAFWIFFLV